MGTVYTYRAADARGRTCKGRIDAADASAASRGLERLGLFPIEVRAVPSRTTTRYEPGFRRRRAVLDVTRAMAALLSAGMPVSRALVAAGQSSAGWMPGLLSDVRMRVDRGGTLAGALRAHGSAFTAFYTGVIDAGERSGDLAGAFERLSRHLEREEELRSRLLSMSIYPALLFVVGLIATFVLIAFVLPRFIELLDGAGAALPRATALLVTAAAGAKSGWPWVLGALLAFPAILAALASTPQGRRVMGRVVLGLPLAGKLRRDSAAAAFARLTGGLLAGGAPLLSALEDVGGCLNDPLARDETERIRKRVREGASLRQALQEGALYPPLLAQLVAVGEEAGRLPTFLLQAASIMERSTERTVERLVAIAEPAMIVVFGGMVGMVALALLQAIYGINAAAFQ